MAYEELKERQSKMWGNGPYQNVTETLTDIHERRHRATRACVRRSLARPRERDGRDRGAAPRQPARA